MDLEPGTRRENQGAIHSGIIEVRGVDEVCRRAHAKRGERAGERGGGEPSVGGG